MKSESHTGLAVRKLLAAALALSFFMLSADVYGQQKKGSTVIITLRDGRTARGELIAVKPKSILILDPAGKDASFELIEIAVVKVFRESRSGKSALTGLLLGAGAGIAGAFLAAGTGEDSDFDRAVGSFSLGMMGGVVGFVVGGIIAIAGGGDLDIRLEGATGLSLRADLQKLTKYARYKEFR